MRAKKKTITDLGPVTSFPQWTEKIIAGLDGQFVPLTAFILIDAALSCLSTHRPSTSSAPTAAFGALREQTFEHQQTKTSNTVSSLPRTLLIFTAVPRTRESNPTRRGCSLHGNFPYRQVCVDHCSSGHRPSGSCCRCG